MPFSPAPAARLLGQERRDSQGSLPKIELEVYLDDNAMEL
jgi:hypothetical protein